MIKQQRCSHVPYLFLDVWLSGPRLRLAGGGHCPFFTTEVRALERLALHLTRKDVSIHCCRSEANCSMSTHMYHETEKHQSLRPPEYRVDNHESGSDTSNIKSPIVDVAPPTAALASVWLYARIPKKNVKETGLVRRTECCKLYVDYRVDDAVTYLVIRLAFPPLMYGCRFPRLQ